MRIRGNIPRAAPLLAIQLCKKLLILIQGKIKDLTNDDNNHDYDDEFYISLNI